ncbi:MAG: hypothetical protein QOG40_2212 [Solirubrobacteraceae bacterium]|nr:hypothetical protein [Solirubrobacteraceae bacterium]
MSTDPSGAPGEPGASAGGAPGQPSEEELRAAYEAELSRITSADMMLQAAVSLLNIGSYRLAGPPPAGEGASQAASGRDLEQVRDAIDGVKALLEILERRIPGELGPLRNALSQLQMAYAREMHPSGAEPPSGAAGPAQGEPQPAGGAPGSKPGEDGGDAAGEQDSSGPGPAESSGRLWVPGR